MNDASQTEGHPLRAYLIFPLVNILLALAFATGFAIAYGYQLHLIPVHILIMLIISVGLTAFLAALAALPGFASWRFAPRVIALFPALLIVALLILYLTDFTTNRLWGENVSLAIVKMIVPEWGDFRNNFPTATHTGEVIIVLLSLAVIGAYQRFSRRFFDSLRALFHPGGTHSIFTPRRRLKSVAAITLFVVGVVVLFQQTWRPGRERFWRGEPITSLFARWNAFFMTPHRVAIQKADARCRAKLPHPKFRHRDVFLFVVDALQARHMGLYGYTRPTTPTLTKLAKNHTTYKAALTASTCSETFCGLISMQASRSFGDLCNRPFRIQDLLHDNGYRVNFILSSNFTSWYNTRFYFGKSIDYYFDGSITRRYTSQDDALILEGLEEVPAKKDVGKPSFFVFHLMSTHLSAVRYPRFNRYSPHRVTQSMAQLLAGELPDPKALINRYDNGVIQSDHFIGKIFEALAKKGYDPAAALTIITADHGEGLGEHGLYGHSMELYQENIQIPFVIFDTPGSPYQNLRFATLLDIAPTIADRLGLPIPGCWEGRSLLKKGITPYSVYQTRRPNPRRAIIHVTPDEKHLYKLIRWSNPHGGIQREELYDLFTDPHEKTDLLTKAPKAPKALIDDLRRRLDKSAAD